MERNLNHVCANVYTLDVGNAWIDAGLRHLWIINREESLSITLFDPKTNEVMDAIYIKKGTGK